jgi:Uma2 family endonuclease
MVTQHPPRPHRLTVTDYYRMAEVGILRPDARVELIEGEIIDMAPIGSRHAGTVEQMAQVLRRAVKNEAMVRTQQPVALDVHSEPEPDITLVVSRDDHYKAAHPNPSDVLLIIEVADTTLRYDRDVKTRLYARHGIPEVWIVDLEGRRLLRYRSPSEMGYARSDSPDVGSAVTLESLPDARIELGPVFA